MTGDFYIVATPIGNLSDITLRALDILKNVDFIACEDTRVTKILLNKYSIQAKVFDCHKFNEKEKSHKIISILKEGKNVAFVSDAGTPCISDPGSCLIEELIKNDIKINSLPGACAITTFLTMVPRKNEEFSFIGFIPRSKKQQIEILKKYKNSNCIFYDSPNRIAETLKNIEEEFGSDKKIAIGRELTKIFEEVKIDTVKNIIQYYNDHPLKGEFICMVFQEESIEMDCSDIKSKIQLLKEEGFSNKDISIILSKLYNENKNNIYKMALKFNPES